MAPSISFEKRCPVGALAWRQYRVPLLSGRSATLGFSLGDPANSLMASLKRKHQAAHLGLLVVLDDDPTSPEDIIVWYHQKMTLTLISQEGAAVISPEIRSVLPRYFAAFFDEIKDVAPGLGDVRLTAPRLLDRTLH